MGQELPDNFVYAHNQSRNSKERQQSRRAEGGIAYTGRTPYRNIQEPGVELLIMSSGCHSALFVTSTTSIVVFLNQSKNTLIKIWDQFSLMTLRGSHVLPALL